MIELLNVRKIYKTKIGETAALDGINLVFPEKGLIFITGKVVVVKLLCLTSSVDLTVLTKVKLLLMARDLRTLLLKNTIVIEIRL